MAAAGQSTIGVDRIVGVESEKRGFETKKRDGGGGEVESLRVDAAVGPTVRGGCCERTSRFEKTVGAASGSERETGRFIAYQEQRGRWGDGGEWGRERG
jgi:hypothetical protein